MVWNTHAILSRVYIVVWKSIRSVKRANQGSLRTKIGFDTFYFECCLVHISESILCVVGLTIYLGCSCLQLGALHKLVLNYDPYTTFWRHYDYKHYLQKLSILSNRGFSGVKSSNSGFYMHKKTWTGKVSYEIWLQAALRWTEFKRYEVRNTLLLSNTAQPQPWAILHRDYVKMCFIMQ